MFELILPLCEIQDRIQEKAQENIIRVHEQGTEPQTTCEIRVWAYWAAACMCELDIGRC